MKITGILFVICIFPSLLRAQDSTTVSAEQRAAFKRNQHALDMNHSGIGISFYRPALGDMTKFEKPWFDINILSDLFEFKFGLGQCSVRGSIPFGYTGTQSVNNKQFGYHFYAGMNIPINFLTIGSQSSPYKSFRGHPVIAAGMGMFNLTNQDKPARSHTARIWYLGINPGYRIRMPFGSIEANLNLRLGMTTGDESEYFKGVGVYPSITFRVDALKWRYNPEMVTVKASQTSISNVQSTTVHTGTSYTSTQRIDHYTTYTSGDVHVTNFDMGIQDIGPHFGIGPKVSFMSPKRSSHIPLSNLFGIVLEGRGGPMDFGVCLEGGRIGHGGELKVKDEDEGKYYRKLDRNTETGQGELTTINLFTQIGFDISPAFLVPFGIAYDKGNATSFLSATAGFNFGAHFSFGQQFLDPADEKVYADKIIDNEGKAKDKFIDPSAAKSGYLGGFYFSVQVGAVAFKVTNYRYYGAPFASTTMYSVAYRFPLKRR